MDKYQYTISKSELKDISLANCIEMYRNSSVFHKLSKPNFVELLAVYCLLHEGTL